ncbi:MAG: M48 family metallopeptidase, partial [Gemmatimonadales bacterium]
MTWRETGVWPGTYFDGKVATRHEVTVRLTPEGIRIEHPFATLVRWPYAATRMPADGSRGALRLEHGREEEPEILLVEDPGFRQALETAAPHLRRRLRQSGRRERVLHYLPIAAAAAAFIALAYAWGVPALANHMATRVPLSWEENVGRTVIRSLPASDDSCATPAGLEQIVARLMATVPDAPYRMRVTLLDAPIMNALAAPGGAIVVYRGLLETAETPEELAGVLAHEIQHVLLQHGTRAVLREVPIRIGISLITGGAGAPVIA